MLGPACQPFKYILHLYESVKWPTLLLRLLIFTFLPVRVQFSAVGPTTNWRGKKRETWSARSGSGPLSIYYLGNLDFAKASCHVGIVLGRLLVNSYPLIINDLYAIIYIKTLFKELIRISICRSANKKKKKGHGLKHFLCLKLM